MFDVLIINGNIVDGTGKKASKADIGIITDKIDQIGNLKDASAKKIIDADGKTISPGFIDTHAHSDAALLIDPIHENGIRQGITTEILGQDGLSYAPLSRENYLLNKRYLAGILGNPPDDLDMSSVEKFRSHYDKKCSINTVYPVAHGALRIETVGFLDRPLLGDDMKKAKQLLYKSLEEGAVGLATGMSYYPNAWSDTKELIELCEVVSDSSKVYVTHLRDRNIERGFGGGGIPEALEIGRQSGVKVHFSHTRTSALNVGQVPEMMKDIDKAKTEGVDVTLELYPYPTGSTYPLSFLPTFAHEGGPDAVIEKLNDPNEFEKIVSTMIEELSPYRREAFNDAVFSYSPNNPELEGMSLVDLAKMNNQSAEVTLCELLRDNKLQLGYRGAPPINVNVWSQLNEDAISLLKRDDYMVGSDAIPMGKYCHPRAYGCFPRFLGRLRRSFWADGLEEMVQRMTQNPAERFGLTGRGVIKKGNFADVVIFDADNINDLATYDDPIQYPVGIEHVLVNGELVVENNKVTGITPGRAIP